MFNYGGAVMTHPITYSPQRDYFLAALGLLGVSALACAFMGSSFGFVAVGTLLGVLCTRQQWARIVILVFAAYVGFVALLVGVFGRGSSSFEGIVAALICAAMLWLLVRPGMDLYFGARARAASQVLRVQPRPGALPHLQTPQAASAPTRTAITAGSTQEQWQRLQNQLRAEQEKEAREAQFASRPPRKPFPWLTFVFTALIYAGSAPFFGAMGQFSLLVVIPLFVSAMLDWVNPRGVILAVLLLNGVVVIAPEHAIVFSAMHGLLQRQGPFVFAAIALLLYVIALCSTGLAGDCESA
jgi:hypothetical protein